MNRRIRLLTVSAVLAVLGLGIAQAASSAARPDPHLYGPVHARTAAQHIVPEATGLTSQKSRIVPNKPGPSKVVVPWNVDGCDHDYGTANMCVPWAVPGTTTAAKCAWLFQQDFAPFAVKGKDRQDLNPAHTALACSSADIKDSTK
jgi:hypothetical protein